MRAIKFRAKTKATNSWCYGDLTTLHSDDFFGEVEHAPVILPDGLKAEDYEMKTDFRRFFIKPETICQITGLKDRNGRDIWEGDVLDFYDPETEASTRPLCGARCEVFYDEENAGFSYRNKCKHEEGYYTNTLSAYQTQRMVVVGTIYD